jgi:hypothetical protein
MIATALAMVAMLVVACVFNALWTAWVHYNHARIVEEIEAHHAKATR